MSSLPETAIAMTIFGGDVVYENSARRSAATAAALSRAASAPCAHGHTTCCCTRAPELLAGRG